MNRREWMQSGLGAAAALLATGQAQGDEPADDPDPVPLIAAMGPRMMAIPIETVELAPSLHVVQGPGGKSPSSRGRTA